MCTPGRHNLIVLNSRKRHKESAPAVEQLKLEMVLGMRRELREMEESIALALSKGAHVEPGVHTAELLPQRRRGECFMKLVILVLLLAVLPAVCSRMSVIEDVNGDGRIDVSDFFESGSSPASTPGKERCFSRVR